MVVACVAVLHALALWGLQGALQRPLLRPVEVALPMQVKLIVPPAPPAAKPPAPRPDLKPPIRQPAKPSKHVVAQRAPQPTPQALSQPAPRAMPPQAEQQSAPEAPSVPMDEPAAMPSSAPAGPPAPAVTTARSSSEAQCPGNPPPPYPPMSRRLGETGRVIVRALIGADGRVHEVNLQRSSGYPRLDDAALQAVHHWHCQPVTRDGVPQAEWRNAPVDFILR